jgi:ubiquinone/menaquinone biosynthesis C-methylase UbiE
MKALWRRLIAFGFRLLYNELAWTYDVVSWLVSRGLWRRWQRTALDFLPAGGRVLEVGFGPGHLLVELAQRDPRASGGRHVFGGRTSLGGRTMFGLDLSPAMLRLARRRLQRHGLDPRLVRGQAQALPFAPGAFAAVVLTFPTPFVYDPAWLRGLTRVLRNGGRLVVVEQAEFEGRGLVSRFLEWLYDVTGQRGPAPDLPARLEEVGLAARRETVAIDGTRVGLVVAEKGGRAGETGRG